MKVLMVSPFPPLRDGVGKYAAQEVAALRRDGHTVDVLAPLACAAHYIEDFKRPWLGLLRLRKYARRYDRVILQYQPAHFHLHAWGPSRALSNLWMAIAFSTMRKLVVVCHEVEYPPEGRTRLRPEVQLAKLAWRWARHVEFHTTHEIDQMERQLGVRPRRAELRDHGKYFSPAVREDKMQARRRLGLDETTPLLLCIGFIQPQKGFDRAIRSFRRVSGEAKLVIVGSVSAGTPEQRAYVNHLYDLASSDVRIDIQERMVSDEEFDRWILASDAVVLPYRLIWSSGVIERAHLLDRPAIVAAAGGMPEQIASSDTIVLDEDELAEAMAKVVGSGSPVMPLLMSAQEASDLVEIESRRRGTGEAALDRALQQLQAMRGVVPVIAPSERRVIGPFVDLVKRVMRRLLGWLLTPLLGQVNEFQRQTVEALRMIVEEQRRQATGSEERSPADGEILPEPGGEAEP